MRSLQDIARRNTEMVDSSNESIKHPNGEFNHNLRKESPPLKIFQKVNVVKIDVEVCILHSKEKGKNCADPMIDMFLVQVWDGAHAAGGGSRRGLSPGQGRDGL